MTKARTADNAGNLAPGFLAQVTAAYGGTRLGRQELEGELIEDRPDALWRREAIEAARVATAPALARIAVAVDPPATSGRDAGACGIIAAGVDEAGQGYVIADATVAGVGPEAWAAQAVALYRRLQADALVAEVNQGGDMVAAVLRVVDATVPVTSVVATRGKYARAEPVCLVCARARAPRRRLSGARGRDVRLRSGRPLERPLARPPRRARLGAHPPHARDARRAAPAGAVARIP